MISKWKSAVKRLKQEIHVYRLVLKDKRTPMRAKIFLWLALGYIFLPFDIIPDFIPIFGQLDDLVIVPMLIIIALKMIPKEVVEDCRAKVNGVR
ncbi:MAG: DUF1232 domain-containing protein [Planctomycetota bacterium]